VPRGTGVVIVEKASGIAIDGLKVESARSETITGVLIGEDVKPGASGFVQTNIHITGLPGMSIMDDRRKEKATQ